MCFFIAAHLNEFKKEFVLKTKSKIDENVFSKSINLVFSIIKFEKYAHERR